MHAIETGDRLFHDGNGTTELGTILPAWWLNQVQAEILAVLGGAEIEPNKADTAQLKAAIKAMIDGARIPLSDAVDRSNSTTAATSKAVKTAYDKAVAVERLANGKAAAGHKHTVADVQGLQQDLDALLGKLLPVSDKIGGFYIVKFPDGTMIQTYSVNIGDNRGSQGYEEHQFTWAVAFVSRPAVSYAVRSNAANAHYAFWVGESHDATGSLHKFRVIEGIRILQDATVILTAIGRWK